MIRTRAAAALVALATSFAEAASDLPRAVRKLEAASAERPGDPAPLERLVQAYADLGEWDAVFALPSRVADQPAETRYRVLRAACKAICDGPGCGKAAPILKDLVQLSLDDADGDLDRAMEASSRGARDQAASALEKFLERRPPPIEVAFALRVVSNQLIACHRCCRPENPRAPGFRVLGRYDDPSEVVPARINVGLRVHPPPGDAGGPGKVNVEVKALILRTGHTLPYQVKSAPNEAWVDAMTRAMREVIHEPARQHGEPVASELVQSYQR
jgi:hypothetical protein